MQTMMPVSFSQAATVIRKTVQPASLEKETAQTPLPLPPQTPPLHP